ncbi:MAG: recombinase family protein [Fusobacterium sp. JB021]|nr:recombinase family protein [Fusobacterium sp. JB021]
MGKKLRAVAYCRVSTAMQEEGRSLEFQIKKCQDFSEFKEYNLIDIIEDVESGGKDDRPGFNRLIEKVRNKEFDILVVYETSRISRVTITMLNFVLDLQRSGIHFLSISQPELNTTTPTGMLFFQIQASLSEYERKQISVRVKSNKWARAKEGIWQGGKLPIGYKREEGIVVIDPEKAKTVKQMFAYY